MDKACYCLHAYISGKVQGVWFRANTKVEADKLAITGWVKNLPDGRVEVMACGHKEALNVLANWLHKGPPLAEVSQVESEELPPQSFVGFEKK